MAWLQEVMNSCSSHPTPDQELNTVLALISHGDCLEATRPGQLDIQDSQNQVQLVEDRRIARLTHPAQDRDASAEGRSFLT